ncbi:MAG: transglycosylase domain-containing protein [bacterium]|nr:transglycosylase domain-containing protein [bacterium]
MSRLPYSVHSPGGWKRMPNRRASSKPRVKKKRSSVARFFSLGRTPKISRRFFSKLITLGVVLFIAAGIFLTFAIAVLSRNLPEPGRLIERTVPISTKIYDREGKTLLYDIHGETNRTPVALDQIAPTAIKATLVAEDRDFYDHSGFALKGMLRSLFLNVFKGGPLRGGSTITQQFVKNAVLTREKTLTRKLKELVLSYRIEKRFSKDEILNMYFNEIPYGSTIYGIEAASQSFFRKSSKDLDLIESVLLASIPQAPTRMSPYGNHTDELIGRARSIINGMVEEGYITKEVAEKAKTEDMIKRIQAKQDNLLAPHFVLFVKEQLVEKYGEDFVEQGGLKVITTLNWNFQTIAEEEVLKGALKNEKQYKGENAALVALDPKTGQILSMVGSRDYFDTTIDGNVNVALRARQPGSSFKPLVYAAALKKGFTADTPLWDVTTTFKVEPKEYTPHNYDNKEHGLLTVRKALAGSLNIPAVKTIYLTGIESVLDLADNLGYSTLKDRSRFGLSLVLGGGEVKLLEHVAAFSSFANDGKSFPTVSILRVEDTTGRVLEQWHPSSPREILEPTIVRELTDILSDNSARTFIFGANNHLTLKDRPVAVKTGTTNDWHDGWALGFTPSLSVGVWAGNNDNTAMKPKADGSLIAAPIWNAFMTRALKGTPVEQFLKPDPRPVTNPILRGQGIGGVSLKVNKTNGKIATETTPPELIEQRTYQAAHSELFYLNRENLEGPSPENPGADPNFENWETAVRTYAEAHGISAEAPPTEYDTPSPETTFPAPNIPQ